MALTCRSKEELKHPTIRFIEDYFFVFASVINNLMCLPTRNKKSHNFLLQGIMVIIKLLNWMRRITRYHLEHPLIFPNFPPPFQII